MTYARSLWVLVFAIVAARNSAALETPCRPVWNVLTLGIGNQLLAVGFTPGGWVAVGESGTLLTSPNGQNWAQVPLTTAITLRGVAWGGDTLVVVGDQGLVLAGENPYDLRPAPQSLGERLNAVAWGNGFFVAGGAASQNLLAGLLIRSANGFHWEDVSPRDLLPVYGVTSSEEGFWAVGWNGSWEQSADGTHWTAGSLAALMHACTFMLRPSFLFAVAASPSLTVATGLVVGDQYPGVGVALVRAPGLPWECTVTEIPPHPFRFLALARSEKEFVAAGLGGVASSQDGRSWQPELALPGVSFYGVAVHGDTWVAVGENGLIAVRTCQKERHPRRILRPIRE